MARPLLVGLSLFQCVLRGIYSGENGTYRSHCCLLAAAWCLSALVRTSILFSVQKNMKLDMHSFEALGCYENTIKPACRTSRPSKEKQTNDSTTADHALGDGPRNQHEVVALQQLRFRGTSLCHVSVGMMACTT